MSRQRGKRSSFLRAALASGAVLLAAGCSSSVAPNPDDAIEASEAMRAWETNPENVLITPHVGQGLATYEIPAAESERLVRFQCLGMGEVTIRVDGDERFSEDCQGASSLSVALTSDGEGNHLENDVAVYVEVVANDDIYWVIGAAASSSG